ncbi:MAG: glycosyltransferase family 9 protein, partial [Promethearchaeota archaeon]
TIFCYTEVVPIYKLGLTSVDFCTVERGYFYFRDRIAGNKARKLLKELNPEIIYDLTGVMTSASLIFTSRAKEMIGKNRDVFKPIYDYYSPLIFKSHLMDFYLDSISSKLPSLMQDSLKEFPVDLNGKRRVLIHPFAGWKAKEWNLTKFVELAASLNKDYDIALITFLNSISEDIQVEIERKKITLIETRSVNNLINCIKDSAVLIGNDSGPVQIASLLGKPTFSIYGPTNPEFHIPLGDYHKYCNSELKCMPSEGEKLCFTNGGRYGCPSFECMNQLSVNVVLNNVQEFLSRVAN